MGLWGDPLNDSVRAQRARKREEPAAAAAGGAESAAATPAPAEPEPVEPEIVVPPAPTDEEVEEAKKEHDTKMQVLKDEVSRLQGDKTKLFQQLKQQCAPRPRPSHGHSHQPLRPQATNESVSHAALARGRDGPRAAAGASGGGGDLRRRNSHPSFHPLLSPASQPPLTLCLTLCRHVPHFLRHRASDH